MDRRRAVWQAAFAIACLLGERSCFSLVVDHQYQQVAAGTTLRFMCQADMPLTQCQVREVFADRVFDLGVEDRRAGYWGSGLRDGQCGFAVDGTAGARSTAGPGIPPEGHPYGCRARAIGGDWEYATTVVELAGPSVQGVLPVAMGPRTILTDPGTRVTVTLAAEGHALQRCQFTWPGTFWVASGSTSVYAIDNADLARGRCQLHLLNVTPNMSGVIVSFAESLSSQGTRRHFMQATTLIVKLAPGAPALSLSKADGVYNDGDVMEASCHVGPARPVARVTWLLEDDVILGEPEDFSKMPWEFEAAKVTRKLSRKLTRADDGKQLVCRVHHIALPRGVIETKAKVSVLWVASREGTFGIPSRISDLAPLVHAAPSGEVNALLGSPRLTWLLIDVGVCLIVVAVTVAALLVCARATGRRWLAKPCDQHSAMQEQAKDATRDSNIYDDVLELASAPTKSLEDYAEAVYDDVDTAQFAHSVKEMR